MLLHISLFLFCLCYYLTSFLFFFFFNDTATPEIYPLSLHDALPICERLDRERVRSVVVEYNQDRTFETTNVGCRLDRKSTRLNSSHSQISYAVFCLKKKKKNHEQLHTTTYIPIKYGSLTTSPSTNIT